MLLVTPEPQHIPQVTHSGECCLIGQKSTNLGESLNLVTHHKTLYHHVEIPLPTGIHSELSRHSNRKHLPKGMPTHNLLTAWIQMDNAPHWAPIVAQGWFKTIYLWCLCTGHSPSITKLVEFHLITFIEDIDLFYLQKMVKQPDLTFGLGLLYQKNTLIIIKYII